MPLLLTIMTNDVLMKIRNRPPMGLSSYQLLKQSRFRHVRLTRRFALSEKRLAKRWAFLMSALARTFVMLLLLELVDDLLGPAHLNLEAHICHLTQPLAQLVHGASRRA